jgi:hypothetical protein
MIMKIEAQVANLELSKRLKELGVPQKSIFYWRTHHPHRGYPIRAKPYLVKARSDQDCSAFMVAELGLMLPDGCGTLRDWESGFTVYSYEKSEDGKTFINHYHTTDTEADARAKAIIYLIENKLLKP